MDLGSLGRAFGVFLRSCLVCSLGRVVCGALVVRGGCVVGGVRVKTCSVVRVVVRVVCGFGFGTSCFLGYLNRLFGSLVLWPFSALCFCSLLLI